MVTEDTDGAVLPTVIVELFTGAEFALPSLATAEQYTVSFLSKSAEPRVEELPTCTLFTYHAYVYEKLLVPSASVVPLGTQVNVVPSNAVVGDRSTEPMTGAVLVTVTELVTGVPVPNPSFGVTRHTID